MLATGFILLTIAIAALLIAGAFAASGKAITEPARRSAFRFRFILFLVIWLGYVSVMSLKGVFLSSALPPKIPLLLVFPAFAFIVFFFASGKFRNIIEYIPASWPVYFQSFRILVELLLLRAFIESLIPKEATFEGYNFDVVIGLAAPFVAMFGFKNGVPRKPLVILYNIAGFVTLSVVVFVFISAAYFPAVWHKAPGTAPITIGVFPYTFLPGFLMPVAVFMHVLSIVKVRAVRN